MRALVQRVDWAQVEVAGKTIGQIGRGLLVYVGIGVNDRPDAAAWLADAGYEVDEVDVPDITETFLAADRASWRTWLEKHHAAKSEIWLVLYKKNTGRAAFSMSARLKMTRRTMSAPASRASSSW